jgi:hypothetical protein
MFYNISGEKTMIIQIPCFLSADKTTFYVLINDEKLKFNKTALFNLVDMAEKSSENCKQLIFVMKRDNEQFTQMETLFTLIDAVRMSQSKMQQVCEASSFAQTYESFGFFELQL